jgi:cytochrome c-type biogenesis protein CcmF
MAPVGLILLFLTGVGPLIAWRRASVANLVDQFAIPTGAAIVTAAVCSFFAPLRVMSPMFNDRIHLPVSIICFAFCAFVVATITQEFWRGTRVRQAHTKLDFFTSLVGLVARGKRRYGGYIVHVAVVLMFLGFAGDAYKKEAAASLDKGETIKLGRYVVKYEDLQHTSDTEKDATTVKVSVMRDGKPYTTMYPAKWAFKSHPDEPPTTEVDIKKTLREDLYLILNEANEQSQLVNIKVVINPLVNWIWIGFLLLAIGTVIAFLPDRAYALAGARDKADKSKAAAVATILVLLLGGAGAARAQETEGDKPSRAGDTAALHYARNDMEADLFKRIRCLCPTCAHALDECAGECGPGERRRVEIQRMVDQGLTKDQIIAWEIEKYGQYTMRTPPNKGWNRLAWLMPAGAILGAAGMLAFLARKWTRKNKKKAEPETTGEKEDKEYSSRLDDELDELD